MIYIKFIKPLFDWLAALFLIVVLCPFWLAGLLLLRLFQGTPVFFLQSRTGFKMREFTLYKIRTLETTSDKNLSLENRTYTRFGKFLRKYGLDEFPQLLNILMGDMSLIGPRPMPIAYDGNYSARQKERFARKPGITGWAQVNGRNAMSWDDRFAMDIWYIEHCTFWLDMKIVGLTVAQLFAGDNNETAMPVFTGSNPA